MEKETSVQTTAQEVTRLDKKALDVLAAAGVIPHDTPVAMLEVFAQTCALHGLSPFRKEIYLIRRMTKNGPVWGTVVGIDGLRSKAARTKEHAGRDDIRYNQKSDGSYATAGDLVMEKLQLISATCTVYRIKGGARIGYTATVLYKEYAPPSGKSPKWDDMPIHMLGKCAEAAAIRMGFGDETAGLIIPEEEAAFADETLASAESRPEVSIDTAELKKKIAKCKTVGALTSLYQSSAMYAEYAEMFTERKNEIIALQNEKAKDG